MRCQSLGPISFDNLIREHPALRVQAGGHQPVSPSAQMVLAVEPGFVSQSAEEMGSHTAALGCLCWGKFKGAAHRKCLASAFLKISTRWLKAHVPALSAFLRSLSQQLFGPGSTRNEQASIPKAWNLPFTNTVASRTDGHDQPGALSPEPQTNPQHKAQHLLQEVPV